MADKLKSGLNAEPESFDSVGLLCSQMVEFASIMNGCSAKEVAAMFEKLFNICDPMVEERGMYKVLQGPHTFLKTFAAI